MGLFVRIYTVFVAKKKKKEEAVFEFSDFNKEEYIKNDFRDSKVAFVAIPFGILIAVITHYMLSSGISTRIAMIVGFTSPILLIKIVPFIVKMDEFPIKKMFGPAITSIFTWLGVFILLSNPPFLDIASPVIEEFEIYDYDGNTWNEMNKENEEYLVPENEEFTITVLVLDNDEVEGVQFTIHSDNGEFIPVEMDDEFPNGYENRWQYQHDGLNAGEYTIKIVATDTEDNVEEITKKFIVS